MRKRTAHFLKLVAAVAVILALATFGFAHRGVAQNTDPDLLAYVQAGGTLDDLCGTLDGSHHLTSQSCEACRLVAGASLPPTDFAVSMCLGDQAGLHVFAYVYPQPSVEIDLSHSVRAPPAI